jgi:hypothetical protein
VGDDTAVLVRTLPADEKSFAAVAVFLAARPVFAATPFGRLTPVLAGQIKGGTHVAALQNGRICGYAGYLHVEPASAQAWLAGKGDLVIDETGRSRTVALSIVAATTPKALPLMIRALQQRAPGVDCLYRRESGAGHRLGPRLMRQVPSKTV